MKDELWSDSIEKEEFYFCSSDDVNYLFMSLCIYLFT